MTIDALVLEVGSTITKANGFRRSDGCLVHVAQGVAPTSVEAGDVGVGVDEAVAHLQDSSGLSARTRRSSSTARQRGACG